jgi:hypothetical protein
VFQELSSQTILSEIAWKNVGMILTDNIVEKGIPFKREEKPLETNQAIKKCTKYGLLSKDVVSFLVVAVHAR